MSPSSSCRPPPPSKLTTCVLTCTSSPSFRLFHCVSVCSRDFDGGSGVQSARLRARRRAAAEHSCAWGGAAPFLRQAGGARKPVRLPPCKLLRRQHAVAAQKALCVRRLPKSRMPSTHFRLALAAHTSARCVLPRFPFAPESWLMSRRHLRSVRESFLGRLCRRRQSVVRA